MNRREFLINTIASLSGLGLLSSICRASPDTATSSPQATGWEKTFYDWLGVLLPADEYGIGGRSATVWQYFTQLRQTPGFEQGFMQGIAYLQTLPLPESTHELQHLLNSQQPIAKFLNALLDLTIEAYYGNDIGWEELNINTPPQPAGFVV